ncbi:MAG: histidine kinase [Bacilli bacterium]|nr:histidine kinase [Bacilli bacterium]
MSIRMRLIFSYLAMLIIPLVLFALATLLLLTAFKSDLKELWNFSINGNNAIWFDSHNETNTFHELKRLVETNPDTLPVYLKKVDNDLKQTHTGVVLRKDGQFIHVTATIIKPEILQQLTDMKQAEHYDDEKIERVGNLIYNIDQFDFTFGDKSQGSLFFIREVNPIVHFAQKFFPLLLIALLLILILTHSVLTYFVSRSIIRPLKKLKEAAKEIKEGNLDFILTNMSRDEIGQLSVAFEEMRIQLKESIEKQLKYEDNRKELLSNISHDLKTPITSIKGYATGIQDGIANTPEMIEKYIEIICSQAEGMDHLIDELFLFSKLDLKRVPFYLEPVNIGKYLDDFIEELQYDLEKNDVSIEVDLHDLRESFVYIDCEKFKRVMTNIFINSVKYMDKPIKVISIKGKEIANSIVIEITDNGQGIEFESVPFIFDRFYRAEQSRNTTTGGSGLGLAIAKQIVEGHDGEIGVQSSYGESTTIYIRLPIFVSGNNA